MNRFPRFCHQPQPTPRPTRPRPTSPPTPSPQVELATDSTTWFCGFDWDWITDNCDLAIREFLTCSVRCLFSGTPFLNRCITSSTHLLQLCACKACPRGDAVECPANQACFASTPCTLSLQGMAAAPLAPLLGYSLCRYHCYHHHPPGHHSSAHTENRQTMPRSMEIS